MSEVGKMDFHISMPNNHDPDRSTKPGRLLTLDQVISWIQRQELDDPTTQGVIKIISKYPTHALPSVRKNFSILVSRVRAEIRKKGEVNEG